MNVFPNRSSKNNLNSLTIWITFIKKYFQSEDNKKRLCGQELLVVTITPSYSIHGFGAMIAWTQGPQIKTMLPGYPAARCGHVKENVTSVSMEI